MESLVALLLILSASGVAELGAARLGRSHGWIGSLGAPIAALLAARPVAQVLGGGETLRAELPWSVPGGVLALELDPLSAFFMVPVLALSALAAIYGRAYLAGYADQRRAGASWLFFNLLCASMVLVLLARNSVLFLIAWETMSLAAYLLVTFEHERVEARRAGWIYLVAAHASTAALLALFVLLGGNFAAPSGAEPAAGLFALALLGFGVKAGLMPLHVWLPEAHAAAPSHVSALMSGAMVKLGFYGMLRVAIALGGVTVVWAEVLVGLGLVGALVAIALAFSQRDLKRALAYSSVENLGLIAFGLGLGLAGMALGDRVLAALGVAAGLFHVWNHAAMKGLLFLAAGAVQHGTGTRDLERLGGLLRRAPRLGLAFAIGAIALAGLPPLSGFASEWLLYLGLLHAVTGDAPLLSLGASLGLALLALVGALAAAAFVRLFGIVFLGEPRTDQARHAHDSGGAMLAVMLSLAAVCVGIGLAPALTLAALHAPLVQVLGIRDGELPLAPVQAGLAPLSELALGLWLACALVGTVLAFRLRARPAVSVSTWGCGYAAVSARMQYSAAAFAELASARFLPATLAARVDTPALRGPLPPGVLLTSSHEEPLTTRVYGPLFSAFASRFARLRRLQQGNAHLYLGYILVAVVAALAWTSLRDWLAR